MKNVQLVRGASQLVWSVSTKLSYVGVGGHSPNLDLEHASTNLPPVSRSWVRTPLFSSFLITDLRCR